MQKWLGLFLLLVGVAALSAAMLIGGTFTAVYLVGFIFTFGREAGKELWQLGSITLGTSLLGYGLIKVGLWLRSRPATLRA